MSILLTGATGFVGKKLLPQLTDPVICSRNATSTKSKFGSLIKDVIQWDPLEKDLDLGNRPAFDSVINLMGEPIAEGRWSIEKKKRIRDSRVVGTRKLVDAIIESNQLPSSFISASAVGIYGDCGEATTNEDHPHGTGFLTEVCEQWEAETLRLQGLGVRVVRLRIGIVLGSGGGALSQLIPIFRWGIGGRLGSGKQWVPWIHVDDLVSLIVWCTKTESVSGAVNATAPNPVRNQELTDQLAKSLKRPALLPVPKFAVRLVLGEFADSLFFSQRVVPEVALKKGFKFQFSDLQIAFEDLFK